MILSFVYTVLRLLSLITFLAIYILLRHRQIIFVPLAKKNPTRKYIQLKYLKQYSQKCKIKIYLNSNPVLYYSV